MPNISQRGVDMPASPIRKLVPLANKAKAKGIKVYHLNIGQPDLPTPDIALEAMRAIDRKVLEYSPSEGIRSFREKLVKYYDKFNIHVTADGLQIKMAFVRGVINSSKRSNEGNAKPSSIVEGMVLITAPLEMAKAM